MNTNDLYVEYARVIEMCKGTALENEPWKCMRWRAKNDCLWNYFNCHPVFESAVAVLEDKPVWIGSKVYHKFPSDSTESVVTDHDSVSVKFDDGWWCLKHSLDKHFAWTPPAPKRTFTLNGVELPCPVDQIPFDDMNNPLKIGHCAFQFENEEDRRQVADMFINLLTEARDK